MKQWRHLVIFSNSEVITLSLIHSIPGSSLKFVAHVHPFQAESGAHSALSRPTNATKAAVARVDIPTLLTDLTATTPVSGSFLQIKHMGAGSTCWVETIVRHGADGTVDGGGCGR